MCFYADNIVMVLHDNTFEGIENKLGTDLVKIQKNFKI